MKKLFTFFAICLLVVLAVSCLKDTPPPPPPPASDSEIVINECYSRGKEGVLPGITTTIEDLDYVELYNPGEVAVDISGYKLSDQSDRSAYVLVPNGTIIAPHGFYVVTVDIIGGFGLSSTGDKVYLDDAAGSQVDFTNFGAMDPNQSWSRYPDGTGEFRMQSPPTPGTTNGGGIVVLTISNVTHTPSAPTETDDVVVTAVVTPGASAITSVTLQWTLNDVAQTAKTMTASGTTYSATITAQAIGATVKYTVVAQDAAGTISSTEYAYTVRDGADVNPIKLNEAYSRGAANNPYGELDWVELYNDSDAAVDVSGYMLSDQTDRRTTALITIPNSTSIPAHGFLVVVVDLTPGFGLSSNGDQVYLDNAQGTEIGHITFGALAETESWAAVPDGSSNFVAQTPSPGVSNSNPVVLPTNPTIANVTRTPSAPTNNDNVMVSAVVTPGEGTLSSVQLQWTLYGAPLTSPMTLAGGSYSATIPAQAIGTKVDYSIVARNSAGGAATVSDNYTVIDATGAPVDYTKLKINEVNGVDKWFEIYNTGTATISLDGVKAYYNSGSSYNLTWTGSATDNIPGGGWFSTKGTTLGTGLSANNANVKLQLRAPDGTTVLDTYQKPDGFEATTAGYPQLRDKAHARIPDGTGDWYYTADGTGTSGVTNGTSTAGLTKFGEEDGTGSTVDYTPLRLNEVNGVSGQKWVEIYNTGTVTINLAGVKINYSNNNGTSFSTQFTFSASDVIQPGGFSATTGTLGSCSANNANVIIRLVSPDPDNDVLDTYTKLIDINNGYDDIKDKAHARIPDGIGPWYYTNTTTGTKNATNSTLANGAIRFGLEDGANVKLRINEVSGVGGDCDKFYELINTGSTPINLENYKIYYNNTAASFPADGNLTWTGLVTHNIAAGGRLLLKGRVGGSYGCTNPEFTTGLSASAIIQVTLKDPTDKPIDRCTRASTTAPANATDKSYSRIPDGTGPFYFTTPSPDVANGADATGLILVPQQ